MAATAYGLHAATGFTRGSHDRFALVTKDARLQANIIDMEGPQTTPRSVEHVCRADLHCHSTASQESKLGVQRAAGLPECATPPEEVYELAKRRGMDFVTITDHDTISGVLQIADRPDVFVSEELRAVDERTWERALARLGDGYRRVLSPSVGHEAVRAA